MIDGAVLITGCSTGIGRATAERLAASGATVWATARRPETIDDLLTKGCRTLPLDVTDDESMVAAVKAVEAEHGSVGALVNNAGYAQEGPLEEVSVEDFRRQFETNVFGLHRMTQLVLPAMRAAGRGRIVNVSSMAGRLTLPGGGAYHASKHAVEALSDALRFEVKRFSVDVVLIEPGLIRTSFGDTVLEELAAAGGPYAKFNEKLVRQVRNAYGGAMGAVFGTGPETVAKVIVDALTASRPRTRYRVTAGARMMIATRRLLPDRAWDVMLRLAFHQPRP